MPSQLWLRFETRNGATIVRPKQQQPPWRVIRAFSSESPEALTHLHNVSGGVLDTDDLRLRVDVGPRANAQITTTGATRLYRSRSAGAVARQRTEIHIAERGLLEYLPDPLIPYAQSRFEQSTAIELETGATLFWWETFAPGREASGEIFQYHALRNSLQLRAGGALVAWEQFVIEPALRDPASAARLGRFRYFSTFYICQAGRDAGSWLELESQLGDLAAELSRPGEVLWGVSTLAGSGLAIRGVALKGRELNMVPFWRVAKWALCARAAVLPRKIY